MTKKIKTIFMGTPEFAVPFLRALAAAPEFELTAVVAQPDKPAGRKQTLASPPVKTEAEKLGLPVFQPEKVSDFFSPALPDGEGANGARPSEQTKSSAIAPETFFPDLIVVVAYGQIIPEKILKLPKYGCVNVHASLLPRYRGAAPIQAAILNGDRETGITIMKMEAGLDTGPILRQNNLRIKAAETSGSLFGKLAETGLKIFISTLKDYTAGKIIPAAQDEKTAVYAPKLKKSDARIDWNRTAREIERMIRAFNPWPGAQFTIGKAGQPITIKILEADGKPLETSGHNPGELFAHNGELAARCGKDALIIKRLQPSGKKPMTGREFMSGHKNILR